VHASYVGKMSKLTVETGADQHIGFISDHTGKAMKHEFAIASVFAALVAISAPASAKGALKGAAEGAVVGHVAGKHAVAGAAVGAAAGRHHANKKDKAAKE
jgi:hypothetical protein